MKTKLEAVTALKKEYLTLQVGDDEQGYEDLSPADYAATIEGWADNRLLEEAKVAEAQTQTAAKAALLAKLGLTADEFKTLLG